MPGELRSRASRMYEFGDMAEVESTLEWLASREDGPYVVRLARVNRASVKTAIYTFFAMMPMSCLSRCLCRKAHQVIFRRALTI